MGWYDISGGYTYLAARPRTSGEAQFHHVPGNGRDPERIQPFTRTSRVCLGLQAQEGRRDG